MPVLETNPTAPQQAAGSGISGEWYFFILISLMIIMGYFLIMYIMQRWFGHGMIVAKDSWQKGMAIIQHFETGKNGTLKLARIEGDAFRHQQIRDGTLAAMPKGVNALGSKPWVNTWALFGASIPADLLAGIAALKNMGLNSVEEVNAKISFTDAKLGLNATVQASNPTLNIKDVEPFDGDTVILKGYDFEDFGKLTAQMNKRVLIPLSIEDVPKYIKKSINPHDTEYVVGLEVENEMGEQKDSGTAYFFLVGMAIFITSLGFLIIWQAIAKPAGG